MITILKQINISQQLLNTIWYNDAPKRGNSGRYVISVY